MWGRTSRDLVPNHASTSPLSTSYYWAVCPKGLGLLTYKYSDTTHFGGQAPEGATSRLLGRAPTFLPFPVTCSSPLRRASRLSGDGIPLPPGIFVPCEPCNFTSSCSGSLLSPVPHRYLKRAIASQTALIFDSEAPSAPNQVSSFGGS